MVFYVAFYFVSRRVLFYIKMTFYHFGHSIPFYIVFFSCYVMLFYIGQVMLPLRRYTSTTYDFTLFYFVLLYFTLFYLL
jgi:hypothetical protein